MCIPGLKECFYKQYAVPRVRRRHAYLTQPPHQHNQGRIFLLIHSTYWFFVTPVPAVFDTQRWRASPVWLLYNLLRAIQLNVHAVK